MEYRQEKLMNVLKSKNYWCFIFLFLLIYTSDDSVLFGTYGNTMYFYAKYVILIFVLLILFVKYRAVKKNIIFMISVLLSFFIFNAIVSDFKFGFIYNVILLLTSLAFANEYSLELFKKNFCVIVCFLSICSLVGYFVNLFIPQLLSPFPDLYNSENISFKNCYLYVTFPSLPLRNFGIFREPGVYMVYLNIALFLEWFSEKPSVNRIVLFLFTLLTTLSTAGFIIGTITLIGGIIYKRRFKDAIMLTPIICIVYYFLTLEDSIFNTMLFGKLEEGTDSGSTAARVASIMVPLEMFFSNPLGVGPDTYDVLFPIMSIRLYGVSIEPEVSTNTFLKYLAVYGFCVCFLYFFYLVRFVRFCFQDRYLILLFMLILLLALSNEDLRTSIFFNIMIAYGISCNVVNNNKTVK